MKKGLMIAGALGLFGINSLQASASAETVNSVDSLLNGVEADSISQVTSVSQLSDVQPTDWAFQALQSLVERYGCIAGYPDSTFRGNRPATRYEMAAALNSCLDNISDRFATKEDLATVQALQEEFQAELATLRGRVDGLEARTATLEAQQFSTTTKLQGQAILAGQFGDFLNNDADTFAAAGGLIGGPGGLVGNSRASVLSRVRLNFNTSFSGSDLLQTQLEVGNGGQDFFGGAGFGGVNPVPSGGAGVASLASGANPIVDLGVTDFSGVGTGVILRRLSYSFKPFGDDFTVTAGSNIFPSDFVDFNSYANNESQDFSSGFFINNPLIVTNAVDFAGGAGGAIDWNVNGGPVSLRATYIAANGSNAIAGATGEVGFAGTVLGGGLGGDPDQATVELEYADTFGSNDQNNFAIRLQYTRANALNIEQNVVGANVETTLGQFGVFGRVGYSIDPQLENAVGPNTDLFPTIENNILTWQGGIGIKDLIVPGSLFAIAAGQPFVVLGGANASPNFESQFNFESFYRVAINENITLTPTVQVITNPGNYSDLVAGGATDDGTIIQGLLRATFSF